MIPTNTEDVGKIHREALGFRFYNAIKASTEDPKKKKYYLELMQKETRHNDKGDKHEQYMPQET